MGREISSEIIQSLPGVFYMIDISGRFLLWNRQLEEVLHCSGEEIARSHPLDFFEGDDRILIEQQIRKVFEEGYTETEATLVSRNGASAPFAFTGKRIEYQGEPVLVGMGVDISYLHNLQKETEALVYRYKALMKSSIDGVHVMDIQGNVIEVNDTFCNMLGYTQNEASKLNVSDWNAQWTKAQLQDRLKSFVGKSARFETVHRRKDGSLLDVEVSVTGIILDDVPCLVASSRDITERKRAEHKNEVMVKRHEALMRSSFEGIHVMDADGNVVEVNDTFCRMLGYTWEEAVRLNVADWDAQWSRKELVERFKELVYQDGAVFETRHRRKDGSVFDVEVSTTGAEIEGQKYLYASSRDITERKGVQKETEALLRRNRALMKNAVDGIHILDMEGNVVEANDAFCRILGYTQEEVARLNVADWDTRWSASELIARTRNFITNLESVTFETVHQRKDGTMIDIEISCTGMEIDGKGYLFAASRDITERKQNQKQTEALLRRYQTLMNAALDGIRIMDLQGNVVEANEAFCNMLGYTHDEALRLNIADWDTRWTKAELLERLQNFIGKKGETFETVQRRKDGSLIDVEVSTTGFEVDGKHYFLASSRDITERKRAEHRNEVMMRRHQALMRSALEGIHIMDEQGNIVESNDAFCQMLGYTQEEMSRLNVADWDVLCETHEELMERFNTLIHSDGVLFESRQRRKDGTVIDVEVSAVGVEIDGRRYLYVSSHDITRRKADERKLEEAQARMSDTLHELEVTFETSGEGFWKVDQSGHIIESNDAYCKMIGYPKNEVVGSHISRFEALEPTPELVREHMGLIRERGVDRFDTRHRRRDGQLIDLEIVVSYVERTDTNIVFMRDVTERKRVEEMLRIAATTFDTQECILITDADANIVRVNQAFQDVTGFSADEVIGNNPRMFRSGRHDANFYRDMWNALNNTGKWSGELWDKRKDGEIYPKQMTITAVYDDKHNVTHYVGVFRDISSRKKSEQEIHRLAFFDSLTLLPNRRLLMDRLQQGLAASARNGMYGALLFLDLDHFKNINDTQGHAFGDQLLVEVARRLQACVREGDSVSRLGGDEFVVVLQDLSGNQEEAATRTETVAEKILNELAKPYFLNGREWHTTASIGVSLFLDHNETVEDLLKYADVAMYQAKSAGRNGIRFFDPAMQTALETRAALESDLRHAHEKQQLRLHYQLQVDEKRRPLGVEALLRWEHPKLGLILPDRFIQLAEETGLIEPIGMWVLVTACDLLKQWHSDENRRHLTISVNVSAKQFRQADFIPQVQSILQASGIVPSRLKFELTESTVLADVEDTIRKMRELKTMGIGFAMDDFGTGYSSLQYLKRLPLDQIKIDQSFVRDIPADPNDAAIVRTIIAMTSVLGLEVIAEGVETESQLEFLEMNGCHAFQGFLFGRPLPLEQLYELLRGAGAPGTQ